MTPEDQAAFESALELIPQYDITRSDLQNLFNAALAHRDAKAAQVNQQMLEALKVLVENGGIGPEQMFHDARAAIAAAEAAKKGGAA